MLSKVLCSEDFSKQHADSFIFDLFLYFRVPSLLRCCDNKNAKQRILNLCDLMWISVLTFLRNKSTS